MTQNENISNERNDMSQDEMLQSILQKLSPTAQSSVAQPASQTPSGDILSSLLSNPELLAKLPTIISSVKPVLDMLGLGASPQSGATAPASAPSAHATAPSKDTRADSRTALLSAMKPYLSPERQNAIDYIVKLGRLGDILKTL